MTPLTSIEKGILEGNWEYVCAGFNKLTGKKMTPPKPKEAVFNAATAKKGDLFKKLAQMGVNLAKLADYSLEDLREMYDVYTNNTTVMDEEETEKVIPPFRPSKDNQLFIVNPTKLMHGDKLPINITPDPILDKIVDSNSSTVKSKRAPADRVKAKCIKCKSQFEDYKKFTSESDGERSGVCATCKESV